MPKKAKKKVLYTILNLEIQHLVYYLTIKQIEAAYLSDIIFEVK